MDTTERRTRARRTGTPEAQAGRTRCPAPHGRRLAVEPAKLIKTPLTRTYDALRARCNSNGELAQWLIEDDPEIDLEAAGRGTGPTDRVLLDPDGQLLYAADEIEIVHDAFGRVLERRQPVVVESNIDADTPLVWTGKMAPAPDAVTRFAFSRAYQGQHVDGLTYDFLYAMAKELDAKGALVLLGAGQNGKDPLVLERNGLPYRGFLSGRVRGPAYMLVLHLCHLELRRPEGDQA